MNRFIEKAIPVFFALLGVALILIWGISYLRAPKLPQRSFDLDAQPVSQSTPGSTPNAVSFYNASVQAPLLPGNWPCFRGPNHDGVNTDTTELAKDWGASGPRKLWSQELGQGYAGAAIAGGRVYVLDYDEAAQADALRCFALADGTEIWRRSYPIVIKPNHGISRTVPSVSGRFVVSLGPKCHVMCADAVTGDQKWRIDLVKDYGATVPEWYAGQCPLIDGNRVILAPGGSSLMIAIDLATGKVLWKTPNPNNWTMTHVSILPITVNGSPMYIYCGSGGVAGISAKDGSLLWQDTDWVIPTAVVPTPVDIGDGRIFLSGGYGAGSMMLRVSNSSVQTLWRVGPEVFGSDQQTPIYYASYIYGVIPGGELACLDLNGKQLWHSGSEHHFGLGPYLIAQGMIYVLEDNGMLTLVNASPDGYHQIAQAKILDGPEAWGPLALVNGRLVARDLRQMVCLDVSNSGHM